MAVVEIHEMQNNVLQRLKTNSGNENTDWANKTGGTFRFKTARNVTVDNNNGIPVPAAGTSRSVPKCLLLNIASFAGAEEVHDLEIYTSGVNPWTGVDVIVKIKDVDWNANGLADNTPANAYDQVPNDVAAYANVAGGASIFTKTSGAGAQDMDAGDPSGGGNPNNGWLDGDISDGVYVGDALYAQMEVQSTASPGALAAATVTFAWTET